MNHFEVCEGQSQPHTPPHAPKHPNRPLRIFYFKYFKPAREKPDCIFFAV
jgi:hypothetical protein